MGRRRSSLNLSITVSCVTTTCAITKSLCKVKDKLKHIIIIITIINVKEKLLFRTNVVIFLLRYIIQDRPLPEE